MRFALFAAMMALTMRQSRPGSALRSGMMLSYSSNGAEAPAWIVESVITDTTLGSMRGCTVARIRTDPARPAETRTMCVRGDTLFTWNGESHIASRPVGVSMTLETRTASGGRAVYTTAASTSRVSIGGSSFDVIETTVTTHDSTGTIVRRLRERFAFALGTAAGGVFEVPDAAAGWRIQNAFELVRVRMR